jgi:hypothetical protein
VRFGDQKVGAPCDVVSFTSGNDRQMARTFASARAVEGLGIVVHLAPQQANGLLCDMRKLLVWVFGLAAVFLSGSAARPRAASAEAMALCTIAPFEWNIVGSNVTREGRLVRVDYLAIGTAPHSGADCPLAGEGIVVRDRAFVLFEPVCGQDGTTPLRGRDPLEYGSGLRMEFRGPISGVVTCGEGGLRTLDMDLMASSPQGARLYLRQIGEVDLAAKALTSLAVTGGELMVR